MELEKIRALIEMFGRTGLGEMTLTEDGTTLRLMRAGAPVPEEPEPEGEAVLSPAYGIVHRGPNPGAAPFVEVGSHVEAGQALCIIEAMKVFTSLTAERAGTVRRILIADGAEVEQGQVLMEIGA